MKKLSRSEIQDFLGKIVAVKVDQPVGSSYDGHGERIVYPINYGFVPGTISGDGEELDAYILGIDRPLEFFEGECIAILHRLNDDDDKLIVVPQGQTFSDEQILRLTHFQERFFISEIWRSKTALT